ncbi:MAG: hypothetical protein QOH57_1888 [Mycobacterium sp.]|nr:hypothetical protein [Mycobacterium sp.]
MTQIGILLADNAPRNTGPDFGKASPFGLLVVVLLLIGTFALVWSMNRHLKKLPESFDPEHPEPDQVVDEGTVETPSDSSGDVGAVGDSHAEMPARDPEGRRREPGS